MLRPDWQNVHAGGALMVGGVCLWLVGAWWFANGAYDVGREFLPKVKR